METSIIREKVLVIVNNYLCKENGNYFSISENMYNDDLIKLGLDSIGFIHIIVNIETEFMCEIPDEKLLLNEMNTINKIVCILEELKKNNANNND